MTEPLKLRWLHMPGPPGIDRYDCYDEGGKLIAWLNSRPSYCDRGHWLAMVDHIPDLDEADCWPRYYCDRQFAFAEIELFLNWRLKGLRGRALFSYPTKDGTPLDHIHIPISYFKAEEQA